MIEVKGLSVGYGEQVVAADVELSFRPGQVVVLAGPNGCGKSTLLRTILGLQEKKAGEILYDGVKLEQLSSREIARKASYVAQSRNVPSIVAKRMVLHGRFPYLSYPRKYSRQDHAAAEQALRWTGASDLADRYMSELSGGQRQKVYLAMALAQDTETIFMDEPTTYLDIQHQLEVMALARRLADQGKAVVLVLHDLSLAMRFADRIAVLAQGKLKMAAEPETIFQSGIIKSVFGVDLKRMLTETGWQFYYESH